MDYEPEDGKWQVAAKARLLLDLRERLGEVQYNKNKRSLQEFLCG